MNQTRLESLIEALVNVAIGFGVGLTSQIVIFHGFGLEVSFMQNFWMTCWFTVISVARSYCIRRFFNAGIKASVHRAAGFINRVVTSIDTMLNKIGGSR